MNEKVTVPCSPIYEARAWQEVAAKFVLLFFGIALWSKWLSLGTGILLTFIWILDSGPRRLGQIIREPLVLGILLLCAVVAVGLLWADYPEAGRMKWRRYFGFLVFIPFLSLLNRHRLPWAIAGLLTGYIIVLLSGVYQWAVSGVQGIPPLNISYLVFSSLLGIGVILLLYLATAIGEIKWKCVLGLGSLFLLLIQFGQYGRGPLLATLLAVFLMVFLTYKTERKALLGIIASLTIVVAVLVYGSNSFQARLEQVEVEAKLSQQGKYDTSLGYRLAMWDVGLHGILEHPFFGHGTGMPESYFEKTVATYKGGIYRDLPQYVGASHYHNDWIEIGMHTGALGILAYGFFLWSWFQTLRAHRLPVLGAALVFFIFLSGLTDTFALYSKIPTFLVVITAIAIAWQKEGNWRKNQEASFSNSLPARSPGPERLENI
ncbi:O-antigen ligase [Nitrosospira multiformis ATCC 25196]|uniref:O-antigen ligase n=1 Tax=Nitrosospira multiformis (strain ATCC 25196 / NCIMB 11849 / C 71) TaxID=323848 RepID=Q2YBZ5_NITMU|nr:O-antigen ligase family protein [Nitrosospira multiformis]ABB73726.1 O-antigen polymerase [Nitrosospira multiformis ATCC 25196]SEF40627.1 O-antigen ligase [Nitrosospira multiformis ATCC 25196]